MFRRWKAEFVERGPETLAGSGREVKTVMVADVVLVCDGEVLIADAALFGRRHRCRPRRSRGVAADPVHKEMALLEAMEEGWL